MSAGTVLCIGAQSSALTQNAQNSHQTDQLTRELCFNFKIGKHERTEQLLKAAR